MTRVFKGRTHNRGDVRLVDLGQPLHPDIPTTPSHPGYKHALVRRHGDSVRADGTSGANDILVLGTHTGTHVDALSHISHEGLLHGGVNADEAQRGGRFASHGAETIAPAVLPGVLLDVPRALGVCRLAPGQQITPEDLETAVKLLPGGRLSLPQGAAVLIRTGWGQLWTKQQEFISHDQGVPGPGPDAGRWLASCRPAFVGSDTTAFEHIPPGMGHAHLPVHRLMLVELGVPIIEMLNLEALAELEETVFDFIISPLPLTGATGSPVRPLALLGPDVRHPENSCPGVAAGVGTEDSF